jgi:ABC-2 type transport system ATP-binding protein
MHGDSQLIIEARQLTRYYGRRIGVKAIHLHIRRGEVFGFLGPNGAGKTTTIRLLLGFLRSSAGRATIFGLDCWKHRASINRDVGYLPGDLRLYPWMTGNRAIEISGLIRGLDLRRAASELGERFRLEMNLSVRKMSRGMRQKLGLLLALAHRPKLLILDEPTSGLDPLIQDELADYLREMAAQGHTVFFSSHTLSEVEQLCDRVAIVRDGCIAADEPLSALRHRAQRSVTLLFRDQETADGVNPPAFLKLSSRVGKRWHGELAGPTPPLIQWASQQPLEDIEIGPPNLESLFRRFYRRPEGTE